MHDYTMQDLLAIHPTGYFTIKHKARPDGNLCTDLTEWLVLEQSPSFFIVYSKGDGYQLKRKRDYEVVMPHEPVSP